MNIEEFFNISEEERDHLVSMHRKIQAVRREVESIKNERKKLDTRLINVQLSCEHPTLKKEHRANTGNYDPSNNHYWTEFSCPDCGMKWTEEGSK